MVLRRLSSSLASLATRIGVGEAAGSRAPSAGAAAAAAGVDAAQGSSGGVTGAAADVVLRFLQLLRMRAWYRAAATRLGNERLPTAVRACACFQRAPRRGERPGGDETTWLRGRPAVRPRAARMRHA